jgi:hypothetical protein
MNKNDKVNAKANVYFGIKFDDITTAKESSTGIPYSQICADCVDKHDIPTRVLSEGTAHESICGVEGCEKESLFYIDFVGEDGKPLPSVERNEEAEKKATVLLNEVSHKRKPKIGKLFFVENEEGRQFSVRILEKGDKYGYQDCCVWENVGLGIEFYDATYAFIEGFYPIGQFVARYFVETLLGHTNGLVLDAQEDVWKISALNMLAIQSWLKKQGFDKTIRLYGVKYDNFEAVRTKLSDRAMGTLVLVEASSYEEAESFANAIMIEQEMNLEDIWYLGQSEMVSNRGSYLKNAEQHFDNIFEKGNVIKVRTSKF